MIVYVIIGLLDYEGGDLVNVYKNKADAELWVAGQMGKKTYDRGYDEYEIKTTNVIGQDQ